jgi:hypothetical protein
MKKATLVFLLILSFVSAKERLAAQMLRTDSLKKILKTHEVKFVTMTRFVNARMTEQSKADGDYNLIYAIRYYPDATIEHRETYTTFGAKLSEAWFDSTGKLSHKVICEYDRCNNLIGKNDYDGSGKINYAVHDSLNIDGELICSNFIDYFHGETKQYPAPVIKRSRGGKVISISGDNINTLGFVYDGSGRCIEDSVKGYAYDERHNWYEYDSSGRLVAIHGTATPNGWPETHSINYIYNTAGELVREICVKQEKRNHAEYDSVITSYSADIFGPIKEVQRFQPQLTRTIKSYWTCDSLTQNRIFVEQITSGTPQTTWPVDSTFYDSGGRVLLYREYARILYPEIIIRDEIIYVYDKTGLLTEVINNRAPGSQYGYTTKTIYSYEFIK